MINKFCKDPAPGKENRKNLPLKLISLIEYSGFCLFVWVGFILSAKRHLMRYSNSSKGQFF
jgi:hypothetical protein